MDLLIREKRAAPPGRCHNCQAENTPEWRRGPDGARTLCNACGLRNPPPPGAVTKLILDWAKHSKKEQEAQRLPVGNGYQEDGMGYRRSQ